MKFLGKILPRSRFIRGVLALASGTAGAQLLAVLASPILTRLYSPEDFGVLAVFVALLAVMSVVSCLRYELAIPLPKSNVVAINTIALAIVINMVFALTVGIGVVVFRQPISQQLGVPSLAEYLWIIPIGIILIGIYRSLTYWSVREKSFNKLARTKFTQAIVGLATQLGIGIQYGTPLGLIAGHVISQSAGVVSLGGQLIRRLTEIKHAVSCRRMMASAKRHVRFPKYDLPASGINTLSANLPQFLLAVLFTPMIAGFYLLAHRVISMPVSILGQAIGQGLYAHAREAAAAGKLVRYVNRIALALAVLIVVPLVIVFLYGEPLFHWVFGADWSIAGVYAGWMVLGASAQFIYSPLSLMLLATSSQHINLTIQMVLFVAKIAAVCIGYIADDALIGVVALSLANAVGYSIGFVLTLRQVNEYQTAVLAQ